MSLISPSEYQEQVKNVPELPLWQSLEWGGYQEALGRETRLYGSGNGEWGMGNGGGGAALVIVDRTAFGLSTWDIPRGPFGEGSETISELLSEIAEDAHNESAIAVYYSPSQEIPIPHSPFPIPKHSKRHEQPEATLVLDLKLSEEELLAQMKPKGRYNIRLAEKHGVRIEESEDIDAFYTLLRQTSDRDGFGIKSKEHYEKFLSDLPGSFLLMAFEGNREKGIGKRELDSPHSPFPIPHSPIAALLGVVQGKTGIYYYGASDYEHRALMAPYLLQWEAVRWCKAEGCAEYDFLGIGSHWGGVTTFKRQFGGREVRYPPEREIVLRPIAKHLLDWKRKLF